MKKKWKAVVVGKFLDQGLPLDFVQWEVKNRWQIEEEFQVIPLSMGFLLFCLLSEDVRSRVLEFSP